MRPPGPLEIILILVIIFIIFGAGKLPQIFEFVGKGFRALRGSRKDEDDEEEKVVKKGSKKKAA
ncbi:MAG: twin-arginine translocase TatA/TatE family subunit [Dehalococcoidia bacterium]|nr:MAG: twin-arginine translocase TatA/TatE family subunit [Dehalococcoidia bacterium]